VPERTVAERMMALFSGFQGAHGTHGEPVQDGPKWAIKTTARTVREPVTRDLWQRHLAGEISLGIIPIREDGTCSWGSIDVDQYGADFLKVIDSAERAKFPLVPCRSKSSGLHLFVFLKKPAPAAVVQSSLRDMAARLGLAGSEIFPKQTAVLADRGDLGNWIVMPYGSSYGGKLREQAGLKKTGAEMVVEEFLSIAEAAAIDPSDLDKLRKAPPRVAGNVGEAAGTRPTGPFSDGPPCLQHLAATGFPPGGRNAALLHAGVYYKRSRPDDWERAVEELNATMAQPLPADEVASVQKSLSRREYQYTCKTEPMASHCDSLVCRGRRFGVGEGSAVPVITGLAKLDTDPPIWFADVEDRRVEATTIQLQSYPQFHALCMERVHRCYAAVKQSDWLVLLGAAMANLTLIDAPPEVGLGGRFLELLEDFLTNRAAAERRDDILSGRPWLDEDGDAVPTLAKTPRYFFRLRDLQAHVTREGVRDMGRNWMAQRLKGLGGAHHQFTIKGTACGCWWVPASCVQPAPRLDLPMGRKEPI
jgi:hypothetical protein